ncbi:MAG: formate dehydrogenase accessory sulfurtransferase FdhD, partial [Pseudomonadota bacterium]
ERPLTIFLNAREIVTAMTIGDHPRWLAVGYLFNQGMLQSFEDVVGVDFEPDIDTVVVRTRTQSDFEHKLAKKMQTSGCAQGTVFGDLMDEIAGAVLPADARVATTALYALTKAVNTQPSLYLKAGAIHGCVLAQGNGPAHAGLDQTGSADAATSPSSQPAAGEMLAYVEDVGRHNAVDKIAGYMLAHGISGADKIFYTTGRLTSEMVIKTVRMGIPILVSRSGFTAWGVELARQTGLTLIGRARGQRFVVLAGAERVVFDADIKGSGEDEPRSARRKSSMAAGAAEERA